MLQKALIVAGVALMAVGIFLLGTLWMENRTLRTQRSLTTSASASPAASPRNTPRPEDIAVEVPTNTVPGLRADDFPDGNVGAEVIFIEYSDLECPFCQRFTPTRQAIQQEYGDRLLHLFRHYPLSNHRNAQAFAETAACVAETAGSVSFHAFVNEMYASNSAGGGVSPDGAVTLTETVGASSSVVRACVQEGRTKDRVSQDVAQGTAAGVSGTPTVFVVGKNGRTFRIVGAHAKEVFDYAIREVQVNR